MQACHIEGVCIVVYAADGAIYAVSRSKVPLAAMRSAFECLFDCALGEDGKVNGGGYLDEEIIYLPKAEVDKRAKAQGVELVGDDCPRCGKPTRLITLQKDGRREFSCQECKLILYRDKRD